MKVRLASLRDENLVLSMAKRFHLEDGHPLAASSALTIRGVLEGSDYAKIFLVEKENEPVGYFVLCYTLSIEFGGLVVILDDFFIEKDFRQKGIGSEVFQEIKTMAKKSGAVLITLEVEKNNIRAKNFYLRHGLQARERTLMSAML